MREGAVLVISEELRRMGEDNATELLNRCCLKYGGWCEECPDLKICTEGWNRYCEWLEWRIRAKRRIRANAR